MMDLSVERRHKKLTRKVNILKEFFFVLNLFKRYLVTLLRYLILGPIIQHEHYHLKNTLR